MDQANFSEDIQLWNRLLNGDQGGVSGLFRKYYRPLLNYGLKMVHREAVVKDCIQELFCSIWDQRQNLSEVEYVRSYLYVSLRRTILRQDEVQKRRDERDKTYSEEFSLEIANQENLIIQEELKEEQKRELKKALETLSHKEKEAIFLKFYSGCTNAEIAQIMEVNRQSVYNYIYRAIEALKKYLDY